MSNEAFIWRYELGEPIATPLGNILRVFEPFTQSFDAATGILRVQFGGAERDIYLGADAAAAGASMGMMISRPLAAPELWDCVLEILRSGNVILFFSDNSTPQYATPGTIEHFPPDLIECLGEPKLIAEPQDIGRILRGK